MGWLILLKGNWKPLIYNGLDLTDRFLVSDSGEIYSIKSKKVLKQVLNKSTGYYGICISLGSRESKMYIKPHVAVACMFVSGRKEELIVNHKDGNKANNNAENLEWVTLKENAAHALKNGLLTTSYKVKCLNTGSVFMSIKEAARWCRLGKNGDSLYDYFKNASRKSAGKHPITKEPLQWELIG